MNKYYRTVLYSVIAVVFGVLIFIYGGYDDSPGAQLIGLILFTIGIIGLVNIREIKMVLQSFSERNKEKF